MLISIYFTFSLRNIRFSSLFAAGDVSRGGTSTTQRQKFHTDDATQRLYNKSGGHGVPNINLSNVTCLVVDFGKVLCLSANEIQRNSNASSRDDYIPQILESWNDSGKDSSDLKPILKADFANLRFLELWEGEACQSILIILEFTWSNKDRLYCETSFYLKNLKFTCLEKFLSLFRIKRKDYHWLVNFFATLLSRYSF